jgi:hypothetical protein
MIPAIWPGDVLSLSPATETSNAKGSVVLFIREGRLFAHRMVGRLGGRSITRGDADRQIGWQPVPLINEGLLLGLNRLWHSLPACSPINFIA